MRQSDSELTASHILFHTKSQIELNKNLTDPQMLARRHHEKKQADFNSIRFSHIMDSRNVGISTIDQRGMYDRSQMRTIKDLNADRRPSIFAPTQRTHSVLSHQSDHNHGANSKSFLLQQLYQ